MSESSPKSPHAGPHKVQLDKIFRIRWLNRQIPGVIQKATQQFNQHLHMGYVAYGGDFFVPPCFEHVQTHIDVLKMEQFHKITQSIFHQMSFLLVYLSKTLRILLKAVMTS